MSNNLKPLYKWTGGKRDEIKIFDKYFPEFIKNQEEYLYVEPFFGGGALYWYLNNNHNIINDLDKELTTFLNTVKNNSQELYSCLSEIAKKINSITEQETSENTAEIKKLRGEIFYEWRNKDRKNGLSQMSDLDRSIRFLVVNQLSFNGMRRFNSRGEFNIPYGNYKHLSNVELLNSSDHLNLLSNTIIENKDYKDVIKDDYDSKNTFMFLDPPYTNAFKEYTNEGEFGMKEQEELANVLKSLKNTKWMLIINSDPFICELYSDFIKDRYPVKYSTNIKNRFDNTSEHLIITNY